MTGVCGVLNSGNLAEWVAGIATCALVYVAWYQLNRFGDNERLKNTLQYLRLYQDPVAMEGVTMTPLDAVERVVLQAPGSPLASQYSTDPVLARTIASNYFAEAAHLYGRGLVDRSLFVGLLGRQVLRYAEALLRIEEDPKYDALRTTDPGFREIVRDALREKERTEVRTMTCVGPGGTTA